MHVDKEITELINVFYERIKPYCSDLNENEVSAIIAGLNDYFASFYEIKEALIKVKEFKDKEDIYDGVWDIRFELVHHIAPHIEALDEPMLKLTGSMEK